MNFNMSKYDVLINLVTVSLLLYMAIDYFSDSDEVLKPKSEIIKEPITAEKSIPKVNIEKKMLTVTTIENKHLNMKPSQSSKESIQERLQKLHQEIYKNNSCNNKDILEHYAYYNKMRTDSGMIPLKRNEVLENSANNHAEYLYENFDYIPHDTSKHYEDNSLPFFTGKNPYNRAFNTGHSSKYVGEGLAFAYTAKESIDGLMTAIYHRFDILDFNTDEVGISDYKLANNCMFSFVHNPSISIANSLCQKDFNTSYDDVSICKDDKKVSASLYRNSVSKIVKSNPKYVLYPPNNSRGIIRKFYGETPDPMPDKDFTGNPSSIQFNHYYYKNKSIKNTSFTIHKKNNNQVLDARILNKRNDPNGIFSRYQYALYPLKILEPYTTYIVKFDYLLNGIEQPPIIWKFTTGRKSDYRNH